MGRISSDHSSLDAPPPSGGSRRNSSPIQFATLGDPRSSSSQSLLPSPSEHENGRRRLLVIYIHGFMGNDASFQSFPAHVHQYLKLALSDTHVVHSKIYPRYKTYKAIDVARDNFSRWLAPHETPTTDVVLVGHSMGGLLAADPSRNQYGAGYFLHRILGTVNLDAPLLGVHPSVITAGIASLFRPKPDAANLSAEPIPDSESPQSLSHATSANTSIYSDPSSPSQHSLAPQRSPGGVPYGMTFDPNFNPSFTNDAPLQDRGWWKNIVHFVEKHNSEGLFDAASYHIMSHLEFGGCLLDINSLKTRYENIRKLEDVDDIKYQGFPHVPPRVRFVQYYTICHGYPKKPKPRDSDNNSEIPESQRETGSSHSASKIPIQSHSRLPNSQDIRDAMPEEDAPPQYSANADDDDNSSLELLAPDPIPEETQSPPESNVSNLPLEDQKDKASECYMPAPESPVNESGTATNLQSKNQTSLSQTPPEKDTDPAADLAEEMAALGLDLPAIPQVPTKPEPPNLEQYTDKDARKLAEKEAKQMQKDYAKLVKDREKAIKERQKIIDKKKKKLAQEAEKREKEERKRRQKEEAAASSTSGGSNDRTDPSSACLDDPTNPQESQADLEMSLPTSPTKQSQNKSKSPKQPKERKFCNIPHKVDGQLDPKWVRIFMKDIDQVGAHTSLFFRGEHYEGFVGDVGQMIVSWVQDDMTKRTILELGAE
ncbi:hypothetical protein F4819DRAFT_492179 [Hypoxylon fuscum]|nr:hypothetical protein F4819DRAFT_492179 [Hypoxylon fuscum]